MRTALVVSVALAAALTASGCGRKQASDLVNGKNLFATKATCGSCHTLARANTHGTVGPNLDVAFETDKRDGLGNSTKGKNARDVAAYVAYAAALPGKDTGELATAVQAKAGPPAVAKAGTLTIPADPTGALAYATNKASAPPGKITFVMPNKAPIQHNIAIKGPVSGNGPIVGSGGTSRFTATLKPGTYMFFCQVPGHEAGGMKGTLTVK